jgi:hypothetical protein
MAVRPRQACEQVAMQRVPALAESGPQAPAAAPPRPRLGRAPQMRRRLSSSTALRPAIPPQASAFTAPASADCRPRCCLAPPQLLPRAALAAPCRGWRCRHCKRAMSGTRGLRGGWPRQTWGRQTRWLRCWLLQRRHACESDGGPPSRRYGCTMWEAIRRPLPCHLEPPATTQPAMIPPTAPNKRDFLRVYIHRAVHRHHMQWSWSPVDQAAQPPLRLHAARAPRPRKEVQA